MNDKLKIRIRHKILMINSLSKFYAGFFCEIFKALFRFELMNYPPQSPFRFKQALKRANILASYFNGINGVNKIKVGNIYVIAYNEGIKIRVKTAQKISALISLRLIYEFLFGMRLKLSFS